MNDTWNPSGTVLIKTDDGERAEHAGSTPAESDRSEDPASKLVQAPKFENNEKRAAGRDHGARR